MSGGIQFVEVEKYLDWSGKLFRALIKHGSSWLCMLHYRKGEINDRASWDQRKLLGQNTLIFFFLPRAGVGGD